jgi:hypothetical protein
LRGRDIRHILHIVIHSLAGFPTGPDLLEQKFVILMTWCMLFSGGESLVLPSAAAACNESLQSPLQTTRSAFMTYREPNDDQSAIRTVIRQRTLLYDFSQPPVQLYFVPQGFTRFRDKIRRRNSPRRTG